MAVNGQIVFPRLGRSIRVTIYERCANCRVGVYGLRRGEGGGIWYGCERCEFTAILGRAPGADPPSDTRS